MARILKPIRSPLRAALRPVIRSPLSFEFTAHEFSGATVLPALTQAATMVITAVDNLLLEDGFDLLLEDGFLLELE